MKKTVLLSLALLVCLCACGGGEGSFSEDDVALTVGGETITADTAVEDVLSLLGEDYEYAEAISCVYEGMDKTYDYADMTLYTYPAADGSGDCLLELHCAGGDVRTSKGVGIGASRNDIVAQYGEDCVETGSILSYQLPVSASENVPASLYFVMKDGAATAIAITSEHRMEQ